jgi:hypothetical protein
MKKSQVVSVIKTIIAENKKQKLQENTIRQMIREVLAEEYKQFGRSYYKIELNNDGDRVINLFSGEEILVQKKGEEQRTDDEITNDIQNTYKPSSDEPTDAEINALLKYGPEGKFGYIDPKNPAAFLRQTPRHLRPSDEPPYGRSRY